MRIIRSLLILAIGVILAGPALAASDTAKSVDSVDEAYIPKLGKITPDGPFRIWTALNNVIPEYALLVGGKELKAKVLKLSARGFTGKSPGNVMEQTERARALLDGLAVKYKLPKAARYSDPLGRAVTPAVVFLNAGNLLDTLVASYFVASKPTELGLGRLYAVPEFTGKKPNDVYGLVELATRRLEVIVN